MSGWSGFTDNELRRMKYENETDLPQQTTENSVMDRGTVQYNPPKVLKVGQQQRKKIREKKVSFPRWDCAVAAEQNNVSKQPPATSKPVQSNIMPNSVQTGTIPIGPTPTASSSQPCSTPTQPNTKEYLPQTNQPQLTKTNNYEKEQKNNKDTTTKELPERSADVESELLKIGVLTDKEVKELQMTTLEQLQHSQKLIEDENKKRQQIIKQTLQQRFKETLTESQRLKEINKQLQQLDQLFQTDVEDLRDKIDDACLLFSQAQKRYQKAEKEYVESKLDFSHKKEVKEQLTEQLYAIIQENEIKKAERLEELMGKLSTDIARCATIPSSQSHSATSPTPALCDTSTNNSIPKDASIQVEISSQVEVETSNHAIQEEEAVTQNEDIVHNMCY